MYDIDYIKYADYIEEIFRKNSLNPSLILDLGCGTGNFCIEMAKRNYEMIGVDISEEMLSCAISKTKNEDLDILYLNQDMTDFELYGTVDVIVSLLDSINYITNKKDIKRMFKWVENYLNPGGLFIFDVNTSYKFENKLADNVFYDVDEELSYIWANNYNKRSKTCEFDLTFFVKKGELYERFDEIHSERAYSNIELQDLITNSGLKLINTFDQFKFVKPSRTSERNFYVCRKV